MTDVVATKLVGDFKRYNIYHFTNESDGTGESGVTKLDISGITDPNGATCTYTAIDRIEFSVWGFNYVVLKWDHSTDDMIAVLFGQGVMDFSDIGGKVDPRSSGGTGDILLTTDGGADGSGYNIVLYVRPKAA